MKHREEERRCELCESARDIADEACVLCDRKGVVRRDHSCRRFTLDLLKLDPSPLKLPLFDKASDFKDLLS